MSFSDVLKKRIAETQEKKAAVLSRLANLDYHLAEISKSINDVLPQVDTIEDDPATIKAEFKSVLAQIPELVASVWRGPVKESEKLDGELLQLQDMARLYEEWEDSRPAPASPVAPSPAAHNEDLKEKVLTGEIEEPSSATARKRKPGTKPPITLGAYRKISSQLESGEDSEG